MGSGQTGTQPIAEVGESLQKTERLLFSTSAWSRRETTMKSSEVAIEQLFPNSSEDQFLDMTPDGLFEAACN